MRNNQRVERVSPDKAEITVQQYHSSTVGQSEGGFYLLAADVLRVDKKSVRIDFYTAKHYAGIADAIEKDVPVPTLTTALFTRFRSRQSESFAEKMLAALRNAFGGHAIRR